MKNFMKTAIKTTLMIVALAVLTFGVSAQDDPKQLYEKAKAEITQTFGIFPSFFDAFPQYALHGAWQSFKELESPGNIDSKNRELIKLAVASQIPCIYCVYFHTASAKAHGATDEELKESVALGAQTRHWSMIIQGAQIEFDDFKKEFQQMMDHMSQNAKK